MLAPQAEANIADAFFKLSCRSRDLYPALATQLLEETGIDIELDRTGTLYCAFTTHDEEEIERRYNWQRQAGLAVEKLTAKEAHEIEPNLAGNLRAALKFPMDTQVENRKLLDALIVANESLGVNFLTNTTAESLTVERGRVTGVDNLPRICQHTKYRCSPAAPGLLSSTLRTPPRKFASNQCADRCSALKLNLCWPVM